MTTAIKKLHDDFLSCVICTDLYKDPCTLGCGHTFCRGCLIQYTRTQRDAVKTNSILCPNCRQVTKSAGMTIENWIRELKPSFLIRGLLDSFASQPGGATDSESLCFSCLQHDVKIRGVSHCTACDIIICDRCVKTHRALPGTSHHVISDLSGGRIVERKRKVMCKIHNTVAEFYCSACKKAICQKCSIIDHRKCDTVVTSESMLPEMRRVLKEMKDTLLLKIQLSESSVTQNISQIAEVKAEKPKLHAVIEKVSQKAVNLIRQKEHKLKEELEAASQNQIQELSAKVNSLEIDIQMYHQHCEFIDQALAAESEMDMFDMYEMCQSEDLELEVMPEENSQSSNIAQISFQNEFNPNTMMKNIQLGSIEIMKKSVASKGTSAVIGTVDLSVESDPHQANPVDITVLDIAGTETLVVADNNNSCLKVFYTLDHQEHHSSLHLSQCPWSITRLTADTVAVSFYSQNQIVVVKVTPELELVSTITTQKKYTGLTALNEITLVAGCKNPPALDILDMSGNIKRSVSLERLVKWPDFLCATNNGNILVSDFMSKSVFCFTPEGAVAFKYSPSGSTTLGEPEGIDTSADGYILVADKKHDTVVQLTETGHYVRDLVTFRDGVDRPHGICLHNNTLYVAQYQTLKVFSVDIRK